MTEMGEERVRLLHAGDGNIVLGRLTQEAAEFWSAELLEVHNLIPRVHWDKENLVDEGPDGSRWDTGLLALMGESVVGICISYRRPAAPEPPFDFDSVYIHRLAVKREMQGHRIGRALVAEAALSGLDRHPDLNFISLQTNDEPANARTIEFYEGLGFEKCGRVYYPDKVDWLMRAHRTKIEERWPDLMPEQREKQSLTPEDWTHTSLFCAQAGREDFVRGNAQTEQIIQAGGLVAFMRAGGTFNEESANT